MASPDFSNFVFQVQLTILKGDCGGVLFRVMGSDPNEKFYEYDVCQDAISGVTDLYRYSGGTNPGIQYIASTFLGARSVAITLNQPVTVTIVAKGSTISMYLNQQIDYAISDSTYTHGQIGLIASNNNSDSTEVAYKNAKVWTP